MVTPLFSTPKPFLKIKNKEKFKAYIKASPNSWLKNVIL
ncbi:hypothetical protein ADIS_4758 [Lunatimonas lonarensis]|uniref:Uncharacterized protein n=1 Tax=Lunatimonas lonarensis TaxID=1232681 RepID=R7ZL37_9BACT|nr:hypothetical protein ADIS_4758 [Lunatimonas lonarensis]